MRSSTDSDKQTIWHIFDERYLLGLLALLFIVGLFLSVLFKEPYIIWILRFVILGLGLALFYLLWNDQVKSESEYENVSDEITQTNSAIQSITEFSVSSSSEKEEQFDFYQEINQFFGNIIKIIQASFAANSAVVFLWNNHSKALQVEFCSSNSRDLKAGTYIDRDGTLPGSVLVNKTVICEKSIPSGQPVQYYEKPIEIRSFLGVPMTISGEIKGVLCIDSLAANDFSDNDVDLLTSFEKLISQGVELISEREKIRLINQSISAQKVFLDSLNDDFSKGNTYVAIGKACKKVFDYDRLSIIMVAQENQDEGVVVKVFGQHDSMPEGYRFPLSEGINGWVIRKNEPLLLGDLEKGDLFRPRYSKLDKSNYGLRSFLGVPINFQNKVFGTISLEIRQPEYYTEWDQNILMILASNFGMAFSVMTDSSIQTEIIINKQ
ncbi:GAF domain-containing protein [candidate division KSB1 bacterium]|nr:GAF domain-containing protein [candidate division KSB1 bacterium]